MATNNVFAYILIFVTTLAVAYATDPTQLQDFCVGVNKAIDALFVNRLFCKGPMAVKVEDFFFQELDMAVNIENNLGSNVTLVSAANLAGLNTLGISIARLDFAPYGLIVPHTHPRAIEVFTVLEGTIYVDFVTSNQPHSGNKLFTKVLNKGDAFVFPQGLIHFQLNVCKSPAISLFGLSSQSPGLITVPNAVVGSQPPIYLEVLSKAFQLDANLVNYLQSRFTMTSECTKLLYHHPY